MQFDILSIPTSYSKVKNLYSLGFPVDTRHGNTSGKDNVGKLTSHGSTGGLFDLGELQLEEVIEKVE